MTQVGGEQQVDHQSSSNPGASGSQSTAQSPSSPKDKLWIATLSLAFTALFMGSIVSIGYLFFVYLRAPDIDIVARWYEETNEATRSEAGAFKTLRVVGEILKNNKPAEYDSLVAIATDENNNQYIATQGPGDTSTFDVGFELRDKSNQALPNITQFEIFAAAIEPRRFWFDATVKDQAILEVNRTDPKSRLIRASWGPFMIVFSLFMLSLVVAVWPLGLHWRLRRARYVLVVILATSQAFLMIYVVSVSIDYAIGDTDPTRETVDEIVDLGVAYVYHGTYIPSMQNQWLLSLTSPDIVSAESGMLETAGVKEMAANASTDVANKSPTTDAATSQSSIRSEASTDVANEPPSTDIATNQRGIGQAILTSQAYDGFGAPLWVILISVIGSSMFLMRNIVLAISGKVEPADSAECATLFAHQFYILFSPLSAIFFYQLLVAGGGALKSVTVGLVALASAVLLSWLLDYSVKTLQGSTGGNSATAGA